jgi:hypothetical protein
LPENHGKLSQIDPRTNQVIATVPVDSWPGIQAMRGLIAVGEGAVWFPSRMNKSIVRLDPRTREVVTTIPIEYPQQGLTLCEGSLWVPALPSAGPCPEAVLHRAGLPRAAAGRQDIRGSDLQLQSIAHGVLSVEQPP